eukprot:scaffold5025_cov145-Amphora_coffeaeformis.AAC.5
MKCMGWYGTGMVVPRLFFSLSSHDVCGRFRRRRHHHMHDDDDEKERQRRPTKKRKRPVSRVSGVWETY